MRTSERINEHFGENVYIFNFYVFSRLLVTGATKDIRNSDISLVKGDIEQEFLRKHAKVIGLSILRLTNAKITAHISCLK